MQDTVKDRRKTLRVPIFVDVRCKSASGTAIECKGVDLGTGGICIKSTDPFSLNEKLDLEFQLPDTSNPIRVDGEIVWSLPQREDDEQNTRYHAAGVKFNNLKKDDKRLLYTYILEILIPNETLLKTHDIFQIMNHIRILPPNDRLRFYDALIGQSVAAAV
jgi:hypothetical protein